MKRRSPVTSTFVKLSSSDELRCNLIDISNHHDRGGAPPDYDKKHPRMKAAEIKNHPAFPTTTWRLVPTQKGKLQVAKDRGGPLGLSWEIHGKGPERLIVS